MATDAPAQLRKGLVVVVSVVGGGRLTARGRPFRAAAATSINAVSRAQRIPSPARLLWLSPLLHAQLSHQLLRRESHPVFGWREVSPPNFARLQVLHPLPFLRMPCWRAGCWRHVSPQRGGLPLMLCALLSPGVGVGVPDWLVVGGGCCTATSQPLALRQGPNEVRGAGGMGVARRLVRGLSATTLRLQAQASQAARVPGGVAADGHSLRAFMATRFEP